MAAPPKDRPVTTSPRHLAYAFAIILLGLAARAGIDKLLALSGGAAQVALWAQVQSVVEMVVGVVAVGLGQGLTVLVAQQPAGAVQRDIFRGALALGAGLAGLVGVALLSLLVSGLAADWWPPHDGRAALAVATAWPVLGATAALLGLVWLNQRSVLALLYDARVVAGDGTVGLFLLGLRAGKA